MIFQENLTFILIVGLFTLFVFFCGCLWFRLFGWVPVLSYIFYRSPYRTAAGLAFYYLILSRTSWWTRLVQAIGRAGVDPRFHLIQHGQIDTKKRYLFCVHPHGIYCEGALYSIIFQKDKFDAAYPGLNYKGAGASQVSYIPLFRELMRGTEGGMIGVSKREMLSAFKSDPTVSIGMCPGGFSEAVFTDARNTVEYSYLKGRKGFVKLAIEAGVDIIPVYQFGVNKLYHTPRGLRGLRARLAQKFAIPMVIWWGWLGTSQPLDDTQVYTVMGDVFPASQYTLEEIDKAHSDYCAALKNLYDTYKDQFGQGDRPLVFIGKDFYDSDVIPQVFRRLGVHTSHVIPNTIEHRLELRQHAEMKRAAAKKKADAIEAERVDQMNEYS